MRKRFFGARRGLTLIELLSVITIIGILAAIIIPTANQALDKARKTKAANHLRQIAMAYISYSQGTGGMAQTIRAENIYDWAGTLAKEAHLNDPTIWVLPEDPAFQKQSAPIPVTILEKGNVSEAFKKMPLSFSVASNVSAHAPASTTPIAWTRGLKRDGTWDQKEGVYGDTGGFIAFLDGHVKWYQDLKPEGSMPGGKLHDLKEKDSSTADIAAAIGVHANILSI